MNPRESTVTSNMTRRKFLHHQSSDSVVSLQMCNKIRSYAVGLMLVEAKDKDIFDT